MAHQTQSDTGANRHLTNNRDLIQDFQQCEPFSVNSIEQSGAVTVTGSGLASIQTTNPDQPLTYPTLYSANAAGSVFSPDRYAMDNRDTIKRWCQIGDTTTRQGAVIFYSHAKTPQPLVTIPLYPRNGLWYMKFIQKHE